MRHFLVNTISNFIANEANKIRIDMQNYIIYRWAKGERKVVLRKEFSKEGLVEWIREDPYREAFLIAEVPVKASTLARIKAGSYKPSPRLANALLAVMGKKTIGSK